MAKSPIRIDRKKLARFCKKHHIVYCALFGSVLTPNFTKKSDVDVLVNFNKKHIPHLFSIVRMESELSDIIGYPVDLKTKNDLSPLLREDVLAKAKVIYGRT